MRDIFEEVILSKNKTVYEWVKYGFVTTNQSRKDRSWSGNTQLLRLKKKVPNAAVSELEDVDKKGPTTTNFTRTKCGLVGRVFANCPRDLIASYQRL